MHRQVQQGKVAQRTGDRVIPPTPMEAMAHARAQRVAALTEACNAYIRAAFPVEGAVATIIDQRRTGSHKAMRAHGWIVAVWRDYLSRVAAVHAETHAEALAGITTDLSNNGSPPYTVHEILAEVAP